MGELILNATREALVLSQKNSEHNESDASKGDYYYYQIGDLTQALPFYLKKIDQGAADQDDFLSLASIAAHMDVKKLHSSCYTMSG